MQAAETVEGKSLDVGQSPSAHGMSKRGAIGHWELDTIIGKGHKQAIVSMVERKSGYAVLAKVPRKTADHVSTAIITCLKPIAAMVKTLTYDNGKEFSEHAATDKALGSVAYFADPYSSWQRGSNENLNGLVCTAARF